MFDAIAPRYDLVNRLMTFRLDVRWRRLAVRSLDLSPGSLVADLASGTGDLCVELAGRHRPISVDLSFGMLHADRSGAPRLQADILRLPVPDGVADGVTCGFALRNLVELGAFFDELGRVVRPGGRIALLDVATPPNPVLPLGPRRLLRQGGAPASAACSPTPPPTGTCRRAWPTSRAPEMLGALRSAGFTSHRHRCCRGHHTADHGDPGGGRG